MCLKICPVDMMHYSVVQIHQHVRGLLAASVFRVDISLLVQRLRHLCLPKCWWNLSTRL